MNKYFISEFNVTLPECEPFGATAVFLLSPSNETEDVAKWVDLDLMKHAAADLIRRYFAVPDDLLAKLRLEFGNPAGYVRSQPFGLEGKEPIENLYKASVTGWFFRKTRKNF